MRGESTLGERGELRVLEGGCWGLLRGSETAQQQHCQRLGHPPEPSVPCFLLPRNSQEDTWSYKASL